MLNAEKKRGRKDTEKQSSTGNSKPGKPTYLPMMMHLEAETKPSTSYDTSAKVGKDAKNAKGRKDSKDANERKDGKNGKSPAPANPTAADSATGNKHSSLLKMLPSALDLLNNYMLLLLLLRVKFIRGTLMRNHCWIGIGAVAARGTVWKSTAVAKSTTVSNSIALVCGHNGLVRVGTWAMDSSRHAWNTLADSKGVGSWLVGGSRGSSQ